MRQAAFTFSPSPPFPCDPLVILSLLCLVSSRLVCKRHVQRQMRKCSVVVCPHSFPKLVQLSSADVRKYDSVCAENSSSNSNRRRRLKRKRKPQRSTFLCAWSCPAQPKKNQGSNRERALIFPTVYPSLTHTRTYKHILFFLLFLLCAFPPLFFTLGTETERHS